MERRMRKKDDALTEVVGFIFVITIFLMLIVMWMLIAVPILAENDETSHTAAVRLEMAELKNDLDTMCISNTVGVKRENTITLAPAGDRTQITLLPNINTPLTSGSLNISRQTGVTVSGETYYPVNITYTSSNQYAANVVYTISGGAMYSGERLTLGRLCNSSGYEYVIAVDEQTKDQMVGGNEASTIQYMLLKTVDDADTKKRYYIFSMKIVYRAEGVQRG
ncbi:MAG: hypothetical protein Q4Q04_05845 [Methanocorpusculum sp.]|nr:hypothetical protein [Methanocorpusculum sp.]